MIYDKICKYLKYIFNFIIQKLKEIIPGQMPWMSIYIYTEE